MSLEGVVRAGSETGNSIVLLLSKVEERANS